ALSHGNDGASVNPVPAEKKGARVAEKGEDFGPEVKGLRARVTLSQAQYEVGEPIPVSYVVKNVSAANVQLWHCGFWPNHEIRVPDGNGREPRVRKLGQERRAAFAPRGGRDRNTPITLTPGAEDIAYEAYDLGKHFDLSRPGRYTVQYFYEDYHGGWEGR